MTRERTVALDFYRSDVLGILRFREEMEANPRMAMVTKLDAVTDMRTPNADAAEYALIRKADIDLVLKELPADQLQLSRFMGQGYRFADIARKLHTTDYAVGYRAKQLLRQLTLAFHQHHILRDHYGYLS